MNLGGPEMLIVLVIVLLVFGAGWLPKAARNLGRTKVEIDKAQKQFEEAKKGVVDAVGLEKADETIRKANRALNKTPKQLLRDATKSSASAAAASTDAVGAESPGASPSGAQQPGDEKILDAEIVSDDGSSGPNPISDQTINVEFDDR